jgi:Ca-activated chloride channel family protein
MRRLTIGVIVTVVLVIATVVGLRLGGPGGEPNVLSVIGRSGETVEVVQWSNGHLMRPGLMKEMAQKFNEANYRTQSGKLIKVEVFNHGSAEQADDLLSRVTKGVPVEREIPNPTVVTPSSADWLVRVNYGAGRTVVDTGESRAICSALIGIVTYRDMAEALGWPDKEIGYADIIALRNDPQGWAAYPGAKAEWGQKPLVAFTDPVTSSTGRSVLFSLYANGATKAPEQLRLKDVGDPGVINAVKEFQRLIDHYMIGTIPLNTKVYQGPRYGHFFIMPEDNLIHLYEGTEQALVDGVTVQAPPIEQPMVMIYPKEGPMIRNNIAGIVDAPWVEGEQVEAANRWVDFLLEDEQQRAFMRSGFRPGSSISLTDESSKIIGRYGLKAEPGVKIQVPELIDPAVAAAIEKSWEDVKRPGIVTFVLDTSGSMSGKKIDQAKQGMTKALDGMAQNNQVGFLTFAENLGTSIPVEPLSVNRFSITNAVQKAKAQGSTALYDAIKAGIEMSDTAPGDPEAIRAVVVLTDGQANRGDTRLDDLIEMTSTREVDIVQFRGFDGDTGAEEEGGRQVSKREVIGTGMALNTSYPIQVFFIGIGEDADMQIGRMIAQATGAEFQGVTDKDLAQVLAEFSKYF